MKQKKAKNSYTLTGFTKSIQVVSTISLLKVICWTIRAIQANTVVLVLTLRTQTQGVPAGLTFVRLCLSFVAFCTF